MNDVKCIRQQLRGPVPSIRTAFNQDGTIDWKGLERLIDEIVTFAGSK